MLSSDDKEFNKIFVQAIDFVSNNNEVSEGADTNQDTTTISLDIDENLQQEQVVDAFVVNIKTRSITVSLSNSYVKKTIVSGIYDDWGETVDKFADRAKKKEVSDKHIEMLTDTLDRTSHVPLIKMDGSE